MRFRRFHIGSAFLIPILTFSLLPVMYFINAISMIFTTNVISGEITDIAGGNMWLGLLLTAAMPAFVEETTFRGAVYQSMRGARPVRAIILSGFLFGMMHMNFNQFVYATVLGIVMAFVVEATGSILASMIMHFCFNGVSVVLMYAMPAFYERFLGNDLEQYSNMLQQSSNITPVQALSTAAMFLPFAVIGLELSALLFYTIAMLNKRWYYLCFLFAKRTKWQRDSFPKPKLINVFTIIGFAICFVMCILNEVATRL